ncbi:DUF58 domain-containing protein [Candidatus Calescamantes bacterium]|nr:DUF58 domain-containing protein [Candidatus Calescamantes bacterium]
MRKYTKTRYGRKIFNYLVLNIVVFAAAVNTGLNLLFFMGILMGIIMILAMISGNNNVRNINIKRRIKSEVYEKEQVKYSYVISSPNRARFIEIEDAFPVHAGSEPAFVDGLEKGKQLQVEAGFTFNIPGVFFLDKISISSSFPIAISKFYKEYTLNDRIVVLPEYFDFTVFPDERLEAMSENEQFGVKIGSGENIWGIKPYEIGDRIRDIDWKISAKKDELMVKIREEPRGKRIWVIPMLKDLAKDQWNADVVRVAASIIKNRIDSDSVIGTVIGSRISLPSGGKGQFFNLLKEMTFTWWERQDIKSFPTIDQFIAQEDILFVVTNSDTKYITSALSDLSRRRVLVVVVHISQGETDRRKMLEAAIANDYIFFGGDRRRLNEVFDNVHN